MAENPASWKRAEVLINGVLDASDELPEGFCGLSVPRRIADALRNAGLLDDADEPERGEEAAFGPRQPEPPAFGGYQPGPYTDADRGYDLWAIGRDHGSAP